MGWVGPGLPTFLAKLSASFKGGLSGAIAPLGFEKVESAPLHF